MLNDNQKRILQLFQASSFLVDKFYFTGGTALSECYLQHRYSDDLDFFSFEKHDSLEVHSTVQNWSEQLKLTINSRTVENTQIYFLTFPDKSELKVDFAYYPYKNVGEFTKLGNTSVDSLLDIAVNKITVIGQRNDIKDFVDLYFLFQKFSVYDLFNYSNVKFRRDYDMLLLAADFSKISTFDYLPRMIVNLKLEDLKTYFENLSAKLGFSVTSK